jgi:sugar phosphate isomerase/epimerase
LLLDTFHMNIEEVDPVAATLDVFRQGRLWHVHVGDSNRRAAGRVGAAGREAWCRRRRA